jgi:hypothetical protein
VRQMVLGFPLNLTRCPKFPVPTIGHVSHRYRDGRTHGRLFVMSSLSPQENAALSKLESNLFMRNFEVEMACDPVGLVSRLTPSFVKSRGTGKARLAIQTHLVTRFHPLSLDSP